MTQEESRPVGFRPNTNGEPGRGARALSKRLREAGVFTISLGSSPGAGRTTFLETTLSLLQLRFRVAALLVAPVTQNEMVRLASSRALVKQITAAPERRLDAGMVHSALDDWNLEELDFLFIENVSSLAFPSSSNLGEDLRLVLLSVTQGEDKPQKYPAFFERADVTVVTMVDLAAAVKFDWGAAERSIEAARPGMEVVRFSARSGEGVRHCLSTLLSRKQEAEAAIVGLPGVARMQSAESNGTIERL